MASKPKQSIFESVDFHPRTNNFHHRTIDISLEQLVVRRGQSFKVSFKLTKPFQPDAHPLTITAVTGQHASEELGTKCLFGIPEPKKQSPPAKVQWRVQLHKSSVPAKGAVVLTIIPPADTPIGMHTLTANYMKEDKVLVCFAVLFNPWCADDSVFMGEEELRKEYVMNEQGLIFRGTANYIHPLDWDLGQFDDGMVEICMKMLDRNLKHKENPAQDVAARGDPIYVGRVISAMINSDDDSGVLEGRWECPYTDGVKPTHWNSSHAILSQWFDNGCQPVKYGQCWVFAGVMCSVMRLLGIPTRIVTNFESAYDDNMNLCIDKYYDYYGFKGEADDSVWFKGQTGLLTPPFISKYGHFWLQTTNIVTFKYRSPGVKVHAPTDDIMNFHVWCESWMTRPDLVEKGNYNGWQVLDPTPQDTSDGVYCCGPAPVKAIRNGHTDFKYDVAFVYAEVNSDCVSWMIAPDGSKTKLFSNTKNVGKSISTKAVGSKNRLDITETYKYAEGTDKEREVYEYAVSRDYSSINGEVEKEVPEEEVRNGGTAGSSAGNATGANRNAAAEKKDPPPQVFMQFEGVSDLMDGKDVNLKLVLHSKSSVARTVSINVNAQAVRHNGITAANIKTDVMEKKLQPGKDLSIAIQVPFSVYNKHMIDCESMKISAVVTDKKEKDQSYLAEHDIVLLDPPISLEVLTQTKLNHEAHALMTFKNPIKETLEDCTLTVSGSGLIKGEMEIKLPQLPPKHEVKVKFYFFPYKVGEKTLLVDFDCATFKDIKTCCTVGVTQKPQQ